MKKDLSNLINTYIIQDDYLYIKEYVLFTKVLETKIKSSEIEEVSMQWTIEKPHRSIYITVGGMTYRLSARRHKRELYNTLKSWCRQNKEGGCEYE